MLRCIRSDSLPMQCPNLPIGRPGFLLFSNFHDKGRGREGGRGRCGGGGDILRDHIGHGPFDRRGQFAPNRRRYDAILSDIQHGYCRVESGHISPGVGGRRREGANPFAAGPISAFLSHCTCASAAIVPRSGLTLTVRVLGYASTVEAAMKRTATAAATARVRLIVTLLILML